MANNVSKAVVLAVTSTIQIHPTCVAVERRNKNGKILGQRIQFGGGTFADLKSQLVASGMKKKAAKLELNRLLTEGNGNLRWAHWQVAQEGLRAAHAVPDYMDVNKNKTSAVARFGFVQPEIKSAAVVVQDNSKLEAMIAALQAENAALKAAQAAPTAPATPAVPANPAS